MTREEHDTDRALAVAEANWLRARGWTQGDGTLSGILRWKHNRAPMARETYTTRDALAITRGDPLRYSQAARRA